MGNNFMRHIEPIHILIQAHSNLHQKIQQLKAFLYTKKIERLFAKKGVLFYGALGLNTLCRDCSSHMTFVRLLYPKGDKLEKVCIGYKVQPTKGLNFLKESECRNSVQITLCISYLQINNILKYYSVSFCVISIIIVFAPTHPLLLCDGICSQILKNIPQFIEQKVSYQFLSPQLYHTLCKFPLNLLTTKFPKNYGIKLEKQQTKVPINIDKYIL